MKRTSASLDKLTPDWSSLMSDAEMRIEVRDAMQDLDQWCPPWLSEHPAARRSYDSLMEELRKVKALYAEE